MNVKDLQTKLEGTARLLRAAGARSQANAIEGVVGLLTASGDVTVAEFVDRSTIAEDGSAADLAQVLREAGADPNKFNPVFERLSDRNFAKGVLFEIAALYTGARKSAWSTKPAALKDIRRKFDERVFQESKARANEGVTPW